MTAIRIAVFVLSALAALSVHGMDFGWGTPDAKPGEKSDDPKDVIWMTGSIQPGDSEKFRQFILKNLDTYMSSRWVYLSSDGGDVIESIRLGRLLKSMYAKAWVPRKAECVSACFNIYIAAVERNASGVDGLMNLGKVGIHRAYFHPKYFSGLSATEAERQQSQLTSLVKRYLEDNLMPNSIIEKMISTASRDIYWLNSADLKAIGSSPVWYEEALIAKCNPLPEKQNLQLMINNTEKWIAEENRMDKCADEFVNATLKQSLRPLLQSPDPFTIGKPTVPKQ